MGLFRRISDIISANLNEMTDSFEDPERMLKQAIREMEQSIHAATDETAKALASEKLVAKELARNEQQVAEWQQRAAQAVTSGDDGLARKALARKQEHQKLVVALQDQLAASQESTKTLRHQLEGMQAKLAEAKRNLASLSARKKAADFKKKMHATAVNADLGVAADDAFAKFERMRDRVERAEAEAEAYAELHSGGEHAPTSVPPLETKDAVEDELAALKRQVRS